MGMIPQKRVPPIRGGPYVVFLGMPAIPVGYSAGFVCLESRDFIRDAVFFL